MVHHKSEPERYKQPILLLWNHHPLQHSHAAVGFPPHMIASGSEDAKGLRMNLVRGHANTPVWSFPPQREHFFSDPILLL
jgi:hypothetical protein